LTCMSVNMHYAFHYASCIAGCKELYADSMLYDQVVGKLYLKWTKRAQE